METIKPGGTSMVAPRKYPEELRERSIRMTSDARQDPASISAWVTQPRQRLRVDPQLLTDPPACAGTRRRVLTGVRRHPDRPLPQFLRVLPRCHHRCSSRLDGLHQTRYSTLRYIRSMHSTSKVTWSESTSATVRGNVIIGSGRTGASRPTNRYTRCSYLSLIHI